MTPYSLFFFAGIRPSCISKSPRSQCCWSILSLQLHHFEHFSPEPSWILIQFSVSTGVHNRFPLPFKQNGPLRWQKRWAFRPCNAWVLERPSISLWRMHLGGEDKLGCAPFPVKNTTWNYTRFLEGINIHLQKEMICFQPSLKLTAKASENRLLQKERIVFQRSIFRCELFVSRRVSWVVPPSQ